MKTKYIIGWIVLVAILVALILFLSSSAPQTNYILRQYSSFAEFDRNVTMYGKLGYHVHHFTHTDREGAVYSIESYTVLFVR